MCEEVLVLVFRRQFRYQFKAAVGANGYFRPIFGFTIGTECHRLSSGAAPKATCIAMVKRSLASYYPGRESAIL
jgi:hypothetical protein